MSGLPIAHGSGGHASGHYGSKVVRIEDYEHLRPKPYTFIQFWFDCMFWWMR